MSLFGTLRSRKGKKLTPEQEKFEIMKKNHLNPLDSSAVMATSTPNLHRLIKPDVRLGVGRSASRDLGADEREDEDGFDVGDDDYPGNLRSPSFSALPSSQSRSRNLEKKTISSGGSGSSISGGSSAASISTSASTSTSTLPRSKRHGTFAPTAGLRSFVSLVSMATSASRSSSKRRKAGFGSSTHLHPNDGDSRLRQASASPSPSRVQKKESAIFYSSGSPAAMSSSPSPDPGTMRERKGSQSVPNFNSLLRKSGKKTHGSHHHHDKNTEPGVISCSSSSSSCADADSASVQDYDNFSLGGQSHLSGSLTRLCKTPEEVARDKVMLQGIKKFNTDPKRGIDFLVLSGIIERTPEQVAQYLKDGEGLSKSAIGIYLGEHPEFNVQVLQAFVNLHDFKDVLLVQALRQFLWSFRLPGESQKIDRMMQCFANRYCELNPNSFKNPDTCYILSFALIMLNTSLHNPNVKNKPTVEQFIRMNRDIDGGDALDTNFIVQLYNAIQAEPYKIPPEDGNDLMLTFFNPDIEGWLWKQGERYKRWKRRWFILSNNCLYYFKFTTDKVPRGIIPLENILVKMTNERTGKQFSFSLHKQSQDARLTEYIKSCKTLSDGQTVPGRHLSYQLATSTQREREHWMNAISQNSSTHSFYTFLAEKKRNLQIMAQRERGTLSRKSRSKKPTVVRKSQISFPVEKPDEEIRKIGTPERDLVPPDVLLPADPIPQSRNRLFAISAENSTGNLSVNDSSDNENDEEQEQDVGSREDLGESYTVSQDSSESPMARRYSDLEKTSTSGVRVPGIDLDSTIEDDSRRRLSRKFSLPSQNRVSQFQSMIDIPITPQIRVASSRDGFVDSSEDVDVDRQGRYFSESLYSDQIEIPEVHQISEGVRQIHVWEKEGVIAEPELPAKTELSPTSSKPQLSGLYLPKYSIQEMNEELTPTPTPNVLAESTLYFTPEKTVYNFRENPAEKTPENIPGNHADKTPEKYPAEKTSVNYPGYSAEITPEKTSVEKTLHKYDSLEMENVKISFDNRTSVQYFANHHQLLEEDSSTATDVCRSTENSSSSDYQEITTQYYDSAKSVPLSFPEKRKSLDKLMRRKSLEQQVNEIKVKQLSITITDEENHDDDKDLLIEARNPNSEFCGDIHPESFGICQKDTTTNVQRPEFDSSESAPVAGNVCESTISYRPLIADCEVSKVVPPNLPNLTSQYARLLESASVDTFVPSTTGVTTGLTTDLQEEVVEACNYVLINSVRHTDV